ncbi:MAG TPA: prepilin-type N-terminal cleavage/methylation domain-containing protein [Clostridiales bacterium]|jgi:prepilin-type N-terminal cleavage/methylation domain-containing protein|nr:prepilin-type N-terminal cleavage/methylation domain-containing protein [Clostridiales bacterium]
MTTAKRAKRGFTLAEVMVAMAIASVISFAALSVVILSNSVSRKATLRFNIVSEIDSLVECFKASDNVDEFEEAITYYYMSGNEEVDITNYFVKNIETDDDPYHFLYSYRMFYNSDRLPIKIEPLLVQNVDGKLVYTGHYSFFIEVQLDISTNPEDPFAVFTAFGNSNKNSDKDLYEIQTDTPFRKNGVFING